MDSGTFEVVAGLAILYAVIRLLKMIFEFITKTISARKNGGSTPAPPTHAVLTHNCFTDDERIRIMKVISKLEPVDWKELERHVDDLHEWHSAEDEDGVKRWIIQKSLKTDISMTREEITKLAMAVEQLASSSATNAELFNRLLKVMARDNRDL